MEKKISELQNIVSNLKPLSSERIQSNNNNETITEYIKLVDGYTKHVRSLHQAYSDTVSNFNTRQEVDEKIKIVKELLYTFDTKFDGIFKSLNIDNIQQKLKNNTYLID